MPHCSPLGAEICSSTMIMGVRWLRVNRYDYLGVCVMIMTVDAGKAVVIPAKAGIQRRNVFRQTYYW